MVEKMKGKSTGRAKPDWEIVCVKVKHEPAL